MTTAERIAETIGNDGEVFASTDGRTLDAACIEGGGKVASVRGYVVYEFADRSAVIISVMPHRWDVRHSQCTCGTCFTCVGTPRCADES